MTRQGSQAWAAARNAQGDVDHAIEGPFTALDRKLWPALVRKARDDLDKRGHIHEIGSPTPWRRSER
jgi:hypothetical protein